MKKVRKTRNNSSIVRILEGIKRKRVTVRQKLILNKKILYRIEICVWRTISILYNLKNRFQVPIKVYKLYHKLRFEFFIFVSLLHFFFYISEKDKHKSRYFSYMMDKYRCNESETVNFKKNLYLQAIFSHFHHRTLVGYEEIDVCRGIKGITALIFY